MPNKLKSYDDATNKLMQQAMSLDVPDGKNFSLPEMVYRLRQSYKYKLTYRRVFNELPPENADPSTGFCIVSSYYIYERTGGAATWQIMQTPLHWWLQHKQTGMHFDITYTQFSQPFPYDMGVPETKIKNDAEFERILREKALILGKSAGME